MSEPYRTLGEVYDRTSKYALATMVLDLLAVNSGHADDVADYELLRDYIDLHETLVEVGRIGTRLPARLREETDT